MGRWDEKDILEEAFDLIDRNDSARLTGEECARACAAYFISSYSLCSFSPPGWEQIVGRLRTSSAGAGGNHSLLPAPPDPPPHPTPPLLHTHTHVHTQSAARRSTSETKLRHPVWKDGSDADHGSVLCPSVKAAWEWISLQRSIRVE